MLKDLYGDGNGGPDAAKAKAILEAAGVTTPVALSLQYNSDDHYGPSSGDEYAMVKEQLEADGLFAVDLQSTEWVQYSKDRVADVYPAYQLGWFPDYSDADNYLAPFFLTNNFLGNHFSDPETEQLILDQAVTPDPAERRRRSRTSRPASANCCRPSRCCRALRSRSPEPESTVSSSTPRSSSVTRSVTK